jgi:hypothetical protein
MQVNLIEAKNWPPKRLRPNFDPCTISGQILAPNTINLLGAKFSPPTILTRQGPNLDPQRPKAKRGQILASPVLERVGSDSPDDDEDSTRWLRADAYMDELNPPSIAFKEDEVDMDDILAILEAIPDEPQAKPKSPRRKTYGAMLNDLRNEVLDLKQEIELRDAYIFSMLQELTKK